MVCGLIKKIKGAEKGRPKTYKVAEGNDVHIWQEFFLDYYTEIEIENPRASNFKVEAIGRRLKVTIL